jgi:large subunit ribosomal protein L6
MSKIGKKNILVPKDASVKTENGVITISGPKGSKILTVNDKIFSTTVNEKNEFNIKPLAKDLDTKTSVMWGTYRSLINNAILGVSIGHQKILDITGVGYRANLKGDVLNLQLGFSHDINFNIPKEVKITVEKMTIITITGVDKELVSKVASDIKTLKSVEPYKGKGIKERGQYILRKEGKKK